MNDKEQGLTNQEIADVLDRVAELLDAQEANPFRVRAYRVAAANVRALQRLVRDVYAKEGVQGLQTLPGVGVSIAHSIGQMIDTGRLDLLEQLQGTTYPELVLATVPGIGPKLAERIHSDLEIETLPELEAAAYDGRLDSLPGFGPRRLRSVRESLAGRFRRRPFTTFQHRNMSLSEQPPVAELLDVDGEYRRKAQLEQLPRIAPQRFNPTGAAWLPILHTERDGNHYSVLYSNTARAHEFGMTHDWVVIYRDDQNGDGQWTVVTARYGPLQGKRIVSGRERECHTYYQRELQPRAEG